jgi:hypothetical protein
MPEEVCMTIGAQQPQTLPLRTLGKTAQVVPVLGLGTVGCGLRPQAEQVALFQKAIDAGVTFLDTGNEATGYGHAQKALGEALHAYRGRVLLTTKCFEPDGARALAALKNHLAELQTDYVDIAYAQSLGAKEMDLATVTAPHGIMKALERAKRDGLCRFIGVSGHNRPDKFLPVLEGFEVDVLMNAASIVARHVYNFEERVWPLARSRGVGLIAMKVFCGVSPRSQARGPHGSRLAREDLHDAFRYAMGLADVATVVVGCHDWQELECLIGWAQSFEPLSDEEHSRVLALGRRYARRWRELHGPAHPAS